MDTAYNTNSLYTYACPFPTNKKGHTGTQTAYSHSRQCNPNPIVIYWPEKRA